MVTHTAIVVHDTCIQSIIQSGTNKVKLKTKKNKKYNQVLIKTYCMCRLNGILRFNLVSDT